MRRAVVLAFALALSAPVLAQDAMNGRRLSEEMCAQCHLVTQGQRRAADTAPTFEEIAANPRWNEQTFTVFLGNPHPNMGSVTVTTREAADILAHVRAQRR